jgi:hypothetical protein
MTSSEEYDEIMKRYELNSHISIPNNAKKYLKYLQLFTNHFKPVTALNVSGH